MKMKKIILILGFIIAVFASNAQMKRYTLQSYYWTKVDSTLILNGENITFDTATTTDGQFIQRVGGEWVNSTAALGLDSLTNVGDGWLRVWYDGNVVDSAYLEQFVVAHDTTLIGLGTEASPLSVDSSIMATINYVDEQIINSNGYNNEAAQDAVGGILDIVGIADIIFTYDDANDSIWADVKDDSHNHVISNIDNLQDSLDSKQDVITGAATTVTTTNLDASRALVSDASGKIAVSSTISSIELGYIDNARSNLQTQIDSIEAGTDDQTASEVDITDAGDYYSSFTVEGALQEIGAQLDVVSIDTMYYSNDTLTTITPTDTFKVEIALPASAGWNYSVQTLSSGTDTLNVANGMNGQIALTANTVINVQNLETGMSGNITVTCSVNGYTLRFTGVTAKTSPYIPAVSGIITTSAVSGATDVYSYYYDGTNFIINGTQEYN